MSFPSSLYILVSFAFLTPALQGQTMLQSVPPRPLPCHESWLPLISNYGSSAETLYVFEKDQSLFIAGKQTDFVRLDPMSDDLFRVASEEPDDRKFLKFRRDRAGIASSIMYRGAEFKRITTGGEGGTTFKIVPLRNVEQLRKEALAGQPPAEKGKFIRPDLVEITKMDSTIKLDIRYATTNNFMNEVFYSQPRAFLQRSAGEAVVRAHRNLKTLGYGLLIHDAYRPWYVTKMFWDATPNDKRDFVADPAKGSRHNRGCAIDITLYELSTGKAVEMPSGYDEFSERAFPTYPGGTSLQRWHRELLRVALEEQGFNVYEWEWWHFDYKDWRRYQILNVTFEQIQ
ncbi:MAG: M15 family metallopeptidase [Ignavibacteriales bacterium]|nr:M15 family metallopeptidase [Ignavibacteriales bacterium]